MATEKSVVSVARVADKRAEQDVSPDAKTPLETESPLLSSAMDRGADYVPPTAPPAVTVHRTLEMDTVKVSPDADPRHAATVRIQREPTRPAPSAPPPPSNDDAARARRGAQHAVAWAVGVALLGGAGILVMNARHPIPATVSEAQPPRADDAPVQPTGPGSAAPTPAMASAAPSPTAPSSAPARPPAPAPAVASSAAPRAAPRAQPRVAPTGEAPIF